VLGHAPPYVVYKSDDARSEKPHAVDEPRRATGSGHG
jgi:hypothetical protein